MPRIIKTLHACRVTSGDDVAAKGVPTFYLSVRLLFWYLYLLGEQDIAPRANSADILQSLLPNGIVFLRLGMGFQDDVIVRLGEIPLCHTFEVGPTLGHSG